MIEKNLLNSFACFDTYLYNQGMQKIWKEITLLQELSKWDKRQGYEISATHSAGMTPEKAFNQWKGSPGHYALIVPSGSTWSDLITVGCFWGKNLGLTLTVTQKLPSVSSPVRLKVQ